ncbi:MAG: hypothetical protein GX442_15890 [Candidatus Riflebacteria bacterium]|nr:hypothetical protein [Candidatus Riflebacteria bacterium]
MNPTNGPSAPATGTPSATTPAAGAGTPPGPVPPATPADRPTAAAPFPLATAVNVLVFAVVLLFCTLVLTERVAEKHERYVASILAQHPGAGPSLEVQPMFRAFQAVRRLVGRLRGFGHLPLFAVLGICLLLVRLPQRRPGRRTEIFCFLISLGALGTAWLLLTFHAILATMIM